MGNEEKDIDQMSDKEFEDYSNALARGEVDPIPEPNEEEENEVKTTESEEETEEKSGEEPKDEETPTPKNESEEDDEEDDDEEDLKDNKDDVGKPTPSMPLSKFNKQKEKWEAKLATTVAEIEKKHQAEMEELKASISSPDATSKSVEADIDKFAEENNITDPSIIKGLVDVIKKSIPGIDPETKALLAEFQETRKKEAEEAAFENDFLKTAAPVLRKLNPNIDEARLKDAKLALQKLAYDDKYVKLDLAEIIALKKDSFVYNLEKKKTVEPSRPGSQVNNNLQDYDNWTEEDIDKASNEEFEKYSNYMAGKSPSRFKVTDKNGNEVK